MPLWQQVEQRFNAWPSIKDFNDLRNLSYDKNYVDEMRLSFIEQTAQSCYEQEICQNRQIPTRLRNWHDFFNNLSWLCWPRLKWSMVRRAVQEKAGPIRTSGQNMLAHLDECGMVFCSSDPHVFHLIKTFQWQTLFFYPYLLESCLPVLMGHGLLEKLLNPFVGITAKVIFLQVDKSFFQKDLMSQMQYIDSKIADYILGPQFIAEPKALCPFPFLGWPHWYLNQDAAFYENKHYFREQRTANETPCIIVR